MPRSARKLWELNSGWKAYHCPHCGRASGSLYKSNQGNGYGLRYVCICGVPVSLPIVSRQLEAPLNSEEQMLMSVFKEGMK